MTLHSRSGATWRAPVARETGRGERSLQFQAVSFGAIGLACTAAYAVIFPLLLHVLAPIAANAAALGLTMAANFAANRAITFDARGGPVARQVAGYAVAYAVSLGASSVVLMALMAALPGRGVAATTALGLVSGVAATAVRFLLLRAWVFRPRA
ncbi:MAG: GtrA family protein [Dehalococcoidia bacterium]